MTAPALRVGSGFHDDQFGDLTVTNVVDQTSSSIGTVVFRLRDRKGLRYDLIEGVCVPAARSRVSRVRWISRVCAVLLFALGLFWAATGTWQGDLVAVFEFAAGAWCWVFQRRMRGQR